MTDFKTIFEQLPSEIIVDNKHYGLSITPWNVSYVAYNQNAQYVLHKTVSADLTIKNKYDRMVDNCIRMLNIIKNTK